MAVTCDHRYRNDNDDRTHRFQRVRRPTTPKRSRRAARCCGSAVVVVSSCVTHSLLVHARAFLSCQASVLFFAPFDDLSPFFSPINGFLGNACRWYCLSAKQLENVPFAVARHIRILEDADRSSVAEGSSESLATTWRSRRRRKRESSGARGAKIATV